MARETRIEHPKGHYFLALRQHIVDMFAGDACAAAIFAYLEYRTNGELDRLEAQRQPDAEPWVEIRMSTLYHHTVRLFCVRSLQERIDRLAERVPFIRVQHIPGHASQYLLDIDLANQSIREGKVYDLGPAILPGSSKPTPRQFCRTTPAILPDYPGNFAGVTPAILPSSKVIEEEIENYRKEERRSHTLSEPKTQTQNPELPPEEFTAQQAPTPNSAPPPPAPASTRGVDIDVALSNSEGFDVEARGAKMISQLKHAHVTLGTLRKEFFAALSRLNQDVGAGGEQIAWDLIHDFAKRDKSLMWNPGAVFLAELRAKSGARRNGHASRSASAPAQRSTPEPSETVTPALDAPESLKMPKMGLPEFVLRWNAAVETPMRLETWGPRAPRTKLAEAEADPEFSARFDEICSKACQLYRAGRMSGINFPWLFRETKGEINWYRLLTDGFAFFAKSPEQLQQQNKPKSAIEELLDEMRGNNNNAAQTRTDRIH